MRQNHGSPLPPVAGVANIHAGIAVQGIATRDCASVLPSTKPEVIETAGWWGRCASYCTLEFVTHAGPLDWMYKIPKAARIDSLLFSSFFGPHLTTSTRPRLNEAQRVYSTNNPGVYKNLHRRKARVFFFFFSFLFAFCASRGRCRTNFKIIFPTLTNLRYICVKSFRDHVISFVKNVA